MSSISSLLSNGYYSLTGQSTSDQTKQTGGIAKLAAIATGTAGNTATSGDNSYALDLSLDALAYIQSLSGTAAPSQSPNGTDNFVLTQAQQKTLDLIIAKYKDEPFTQSTFDQIQDDLKASGLSTDTLAAQEKVRQFNPTQFLLNALNGTGSDGSGDTALDRLINGGSDTSQSKNDTKATNFMKRVADLWARSSATAKDASSS